MDVQKCARGMAERWKICERVGWLLREEVSVVIMCETLMYIEAGILVEGAVLVKGVKMNGRQR